MAEPILLSETDRRGVVRLTFNRPERANAVGAESFGLLAAELRRIEADDACRVVVLAGRGKHFCSGADLSGRSEHPTGAQFSTIGEVTLLLDTLPKPVIAAVQGACIGAGVAFASCADLVVAADDAFFALPEVRLGFSPSPLIPVFMAAMGARMLRRYLTTGERFDAAAAYRSGLAHEVVPAAELEPTVSRMVEEALAAAPHAVAGGKSASRLIANQPVTSDLIQLLQQQFDSARQSDEAREGQASFREKRKPSWVPTGQEES